MSFANLKSKSMDISKLVNAASAAAGQTKTTNKYQDDRKWKPTVDDQGNGYAVIRFLPAAEGQDLPWVCVYKYHSILCNFYTLFKINSCSSLFIHNPNLYCIWFKI